MIEFVFATLVFIGLYFIIGMTATAIAVVIELAFGILINPILLFLIVGVIFTYILLKEITE